MRIVDLAAMPPHHCAVVPFISNSNARAGFIDTGMDVFGRVYISRAEAGVQIAEAIGWSPPSVVREKDAEIAALVAELDQVKADLAESERQIEAIDFLGSKDFVARQKRGPKKKEQPSTAKAG